MTGYREEPSALGSLADPEMLTVLGNTIVLSALVVLFATLMAAPLAVLMSWTRMGRHTWVDVVVMIPFMTPPFAASMAWMDFTRGGGVAEQILGQAAGGGAHAFIYSVFGMAFIMACELFPFLYLILRNAFDGVSASLIESARVMGASWGAIAGRIIAPVVAGPYSLGALIVFIKAAGEFGTPVTLGNAIGFPVLVSAIHQNVTVDPVSFSQAAASSSVLFGLGVTVWAVQQWAARNDVTSGGRATRRVRLALTSVWAGVAWVYAAVVFAASVVIPYISIILGAMTILRSKLPTPNNLTFDYFGIVLAKRSAREALLNSAMLGFIGATLAVIVAVAVALAAYRRRDPVSKTNDFLAVGPDTVPGIVMAVGLILLWNAPWLPVTPYGSRWILVVGYAAIFLPMAVQKRQDIPRVVVPDLHRGGPGRGSIQSCHLRTGYPPAAFAGHRRRLVARILGGHPRASSRLAHPSAEATAAVALDHEPVRAGPPRRGHGHDAYRRGQFDGHPDCGHGAPASSRPRPGPDRSRCQRCRRNCP